MVAMVKIGFPLRSAVTFRSNKLDQIGNYFMGRGDVGGTTPNICLSHIPARIGGDGPDFSSLQGFLGDRVAVVDTLK